MAYGDFGKTTELEAVNICLGCIGEQPVSAIGTGVSKATIARDLIYEISRDVQLEGLQCNTEEDYELTLDENSELVLPSNCIDVDTDYLYQNDLVERDGKLYDRANHTYTMEENVKVTVVLFLTWDELPEHVRRYVGIQAARIFQKRFVSDPEMHRFTEDDEAKAKRQFQRKELNNEDVSLFDNFYLNRGVRR